MEYGKRPNYFTLFLLAFSLIFTSPDYSNAFDISVGEGKVKASSSDTTPDYLDGKVDDGTDGTIEVNSNAIRSKAWTRTNSTTTIAPRTTNDNLDMGTGVITGGQISVDNLLLDGNTLSSTDTNGDILIAPNGTGDVGIGTTSPAGKLDVAFGGMTMVLGGDNGATSRTDTTEKRLKISGYHYTNAEEPMGVIYGVSNATANQVVIGGGSTFLNAATEIYFYTASDTTTVAGTRRMNISKTGNILIGIPVESGNLAGGILMKSGTAASASPADAVSMWVADTNGTAGEAGLHIRTEDGTSHVFGDVVGIGNTAPYEKLDVSGNVKVAGSGSGYMGIGFGDPTSAISAGGVYVIRANAAVSGSGNILHVAGYDGLAFHTNDVPSSAAYTRMSISSTGNILIGKPTASGNLAGGILMASGTAASASPADAVSMWVADTNGTAGEAGLHIRTEDGTSHVFGDVVGIGTTTPNATLAIAGSQSVKRTDSGAADYNPSALTTDYLITANNSAAARAITISSEDVATGTAANPRIFVIKDEYGAATTYNLTITLEGGGTIDGGASAVISSNYDSVTLYCTGTNAFIY